MRSDRSITIVLVSIDACYLRIEGDTVCSRKRNVISYMNSCKILSSNPSLNPSPHIAVIRRSRNFICKFLSKIYTLIYAVVNFVRNVHLCCCDLILNSILARLAQLAIHRHSNHSSLNRLSCCIVCRSSCKQIIFRNSIGGEV